MTAHTYISISLESSYFSSSFVNLKLVFSTYHVTNQMILPQQNPKINWNAIPRLKFIKESATFCHIPVTCPTTLTFCLIAWVLFLKFYQGICYFLLLTCHLIYTFIFCLIAWVLFLKFYQGICYFLLHSCHLLYHLNLLFDRLSLPSQYCSVLFCLWCWFPHIPSLSFPQDSWLWVGIPVHTSADSICWCLLLSVSSATLFDKPLKLITLWVILLKIKIFSI